ncbi:MAG: hypothetical protein IPO73_10740 [Gemmatimonadetes bacterium]|nr:hypothetical protein [Gemmatimonadota bacterium]
MEAGRRGGPGYRAGGRGDRILLTQDPIGLAGGVNLYAYAGNNPIAFSDPYGLCTKWQAGWIRTCSPKMISASQQGCCPGAPPPLGLSAEAGFAASSQVLLRNQAGSADASIRLWPAMGCAQTSGAGPNSTTACGSRLAKSSPRPSASTGDRRGRGPSVGTTQRGATLRRG